HSGAKLSSTVTIAEQDAVLPKLSVAVRMTMFSPIWLQLKVSGVTSRIGMLQSSETPSTSSGVITTIPFSSRLTVISMHITMGGISSIVTSAIQVSVFPYASTTINATCCVPTSPQSKSYCERNKVSIPQLSVDPPSI